MAGSVGWFRPTAEHGLDRRRLGEAERIPGITAEKANEVEVGSLVLRELN